MVLLTPGILTHEMARATHFTDEGAETQSCGWQSWDEAPKSLVAGLWVFVTLFSFSISSILPPLGSRHHCPIVQIVN